MERVVAVLVVILAACTTSPVDIMQSAETTDIINVSTNDFRCINNMKKIKNSVNGTSIFNRALALSKYLNCPAHAKRYPDGIVTFSSTTCFASFT